MAKTYAAELQLLLIALSAGLLFATTLVVVTRAQGLDVTALTGDAGNYIQLAENLLAHNAFGLFENGQWYPESFRAPGYPAFLALLFAQFHNWLAVLLVHVMLTSVAPVLLYVLFKSYHERAAWWGSVIFALEPTRLFLSASLLSDALFTCVFLASLVALEWGRREHRVSYFVYAGLLLGASILLRPIAQFLPLLYAGFILLTLRQWKQSVARVLLLLCAVGVVVFPWMVRNYYHFNSWSLSSVGAANLMIYNAPAYLADYPNEEGIAVLEAFRAEQRVLPREEALSIERSSVFTSTFLEVIRGHEASYTLFHVAKTAPFFVTDGLREIVRVSGVALVAPPNISSLLLSGNMRGILEYLQVGGVAIVLLLLGSGFFLWVFLSFVYTSIQTLRGRALPHTALFFVVLVFYFALLTGPVSNARYRNPVAGVMIVFALCAYASKRTLPGRVLH